MTRVPQIKPDINMDKKNSFLFFSNEWIFRMDNRELRRDQDFNLAPFTLSTWIILSRDNIFASSFLPVIKLRAKIFTNEISRKVKNTLLSSSLAERKIINYAITLFVILCYQIYLATHRWIPFTEPLQIET